MGVAPKSANCTSKTSTFKALDGSSCIVVVSLALKISQLDRSFCCCDDRTQEAAPPLELQATIGGFLAGGFLASLVARPNDAPPKETAIRHGGGGSGVHLAHAFVCPLSCLCPQNPYLHPSPPSVSLPDHACVSPAVSPPLLSLSPEPLPAPAPLRGP